MDKGYYDYDYEKPKVVLKQKTYEETVKSDEQLRKMLGLFGWGEDKVSPSAEEIQQSVLRQMGQRNV